MLLTNYNIRTNESHPFHLVKPSPWPFMTSLATLLFLLSFVMYTHYVSLGIMILFGVIFFKSLERNSAKPILIYNTSLSLSQTAENGVADLSTPCMFFGWKLIAMGIILFVGFCALAFWFFRNPEAALNKITAHPFGYWLFQKFRAILFTYQLFLLAIVGNFIILVGWQNYYWIVILLLGIPGTIVIYYFFQEQIDYFYMRLFIWSSSIYSKLLGAQDKYSNTEINISVFFFILLRNVVFSRYKTNMRWYESLVNSTTI